MWYTDNMPGVGMVLDYALYDILQVEDGKDTTKRELKKQRHRQETAFQCVRVRFDGEDDYSMPNAALVDHQSQGCNCYLCFFNRLVLAPPSITGTARLNKIGTDLMRSVFRSTYTAPLVRIRLRPGEMTTQHYQPRNSRTCFCRRTEAGLVL